MTPKLERWEDSPRLMASLDQGFNHHFSSSIGSPTHQQKMEWEREKAANGGHRKKDDKADKRD